MNPLALRLRRLLSLEQVGTDLSADSRPVAVSFGRRAQSSVVGYALIIAITVTAVSVLVVAGGGALSDLQGSVADDNAENAMLELNSEASLVALGGSSHRQVDFGTTDDATFETYDGARIVVENGTETLLEETITTLEYRRGDTHIAYQGGGTWRTDGDTTRMVSPPEFHYRGATLTMPLVDLDGTVAGSATTIAAQNPDTTLQDRRRVGETESITVTVESRYYESWGRFFADRTDGTVSYDHDTESVTLELTNDPERPDIGGPVVSTTASEELELDGKFVVNAYDSSTGGPSANPGQGEPMTGGQFVATGDIDIADHRIDINGDLLAGGAVSLGGADIDGEIRCAAGNENCHADGVETNTAVPSPQPAAEVVDADTLYQKVDSIGDGTANDDVDAISGRELDIDDGDTVTLEAGSYDLDALDIDEGTLELDTSSGDIELSADDVDVSGDGNPGQGSADTSITVAGDGSVELGVAGEFELDGADVDIEDDAVVRMYVSDADREADIDIDDSSVNYDTNEANSTQLWLYGPPDTDADIQDSVFSGVLYAPTDGTTDDADIELDGDTSVAGAIVGAVEGVDLDGGQSHISYDEALETQVVETLGGPDPIEVEHVHLSVNRIELVDE